MLALLENLLIIAAALIPHLAPLLFPSSESKDVTNAENHAQEWADRVTDDNFADRMRKYEQRLHADGSNGSALHPGAN